MAPDDQSLAPMIHKFDGHVFLSEVERVALFAIPHRISNLDAGAYLVREGDKTEKCCVLLSGFSYRSRTAGDGSRQILAFNMRGDLVDFQNSIISIADHSVQTLTRSVVAYISHKDIIDIAVHYPNVGRALWRQTLVESSIAREWMVNLGRRSARQRISHFICEIALLQKAAKVTDGLALVWPLTQEQVADATGLTAVHVNRTIQLLRREEIIALDRHVLAINDWEALRQIGDFRSAYLHQREAA